MARLYTCHPTTAQQLSIYRWRSVGERTNYTPPQFHEAPTSIFRHDIIDQLLHIGHCVPHKRKLTLDDFYSPFHTSIYYARCLGTIHTHIYKTL